MIEGPEEQEGQLAARLADESLESARNKAPLHWEEAALMESRANRAARRAEHKELMAVLGAISRKARYYPSSEPE